MLIGNSYVYKTETPTYDVYITIVEDKSTNMPTQIFINAGRSGSDEMAWSDCVARILSGLLQAGIKMEDILLYLDGITTTYKSSGPMQVARILRRYWNEKNNVDYMQGVA
jgi:hypothetical protein